MEHFLARIFTPVAVVGVVAVGLAALIVFVYAVYVAACLAIDWLRDI